MKRIIVNRKTATGKIIKSFPNKNRFTLLFFFLLNCGFQRLNQVAVLQSFWKRFSFYCSFSMVAVFIACDRLIFRLDFMRLGPLAQWMSLFHYHYDRYNKKLYFIYFMSLTMEASLHTTHFELYEILKRILIYLNGLNELLMKQSFVVKFFF